MDCKSFQKNVDAFDAHELDAELHAQAAEHFKHCKACADHVTSIQDMKRALKRAFQDEQAPPGLAEKIRAELSASVSGVAGRTDSLTRWFVPMGMAAAIAFVAWTILSFDAAELITGGPTNVVEAQFVSDSQTRHRDCIKLGPSHHRAELPHDIRLLPPPLSRLVGLPVIVPDLSADGFTLQSADTCGVGDTPGAHVVYENKTTNRLISIFTLEQRNRFRPTPDFKIGQRACFLGTREDPIVVAWHERHATYVIVASESLDTIRRIVQQIP